MKRKQIEITDADYPLQRITFNIDPRAVLQIDDIADSNAVSRSEVLRDALYWWLAVVNGPEQKGGKWGGGNWTISKHWK